MKKTKTKAMALVLAVAMPGMSVLSCSGKVGREFRDSALEGASNAVSGSVFDLLSSWLPPTEG